MTVRSDWFTSARFRRLGDLLVSISSLPSSLSDKETEIVLWRKCGGPLAETRDLIKTLIALKLVRPSGQELVRTQSGHQIAKKIRTQDHRLLALTIIRAGYFHDQARVLLEVGGLDESGNLRCPTRVARTGASQLVGLLENWDGVQLFPELMIPSHIVQELNTTWALLPPVTFPAWAAERKEVGNRAEMYTVQYERERVGHSFIFWVARDTDSLGWDVEDRSQTPYRYIEVKGRRDSELVFYLSDKEWNKAHELASNYELQFWGGIDLTVDPAVEYHKLIATGYPIVIRNLAAELLNSLEAVAVSWKITQPQMVKSGRLIDLKD
jgi:Protein NO VEIN, C-terminal